MTDAETNIVKMALQDIRMIAAKALDKLALSPEQRGEIRIGECELNIDKRSLRKGYKPVKLTRLEFDLLAYLAANRGKVFSRDDLMSEVWGVEYMGTNRSVDTMIGALRRKIEPSPPNPIYLITVYSYGYKLSDMI